MHLRRTNPVLSTRTQRTGRPSTVVKVGRASAKNGNTNPTPKPSEGSPLVPEPEAMPASPSVLNLDFESSQTPPVAAPVVSSNLKTTGLHRAPLTGGVKTATLKYDLPSPPVAVRNLIEHARFGHLCTTMSGMHHRRAGYPFGTLIDFATDGAGYPIFCLSPLAIHSRNLVEEAKASLVVQMPGWTGLANARVTIFGDIHQLPADMQVTARDIFFAKHANERKERFVTGNFVYFRMNRIVDVYFVGGFGTVQWIDPQEFLSAQPDEILLHHPHRLLQELNNNYGEGMRRVFSPPAMATADVDVTFISVDANGADVRVRTGSEYTIERLSFHTLVTKAEEVHEAVKSVLSGQH